VSGGKRPDDVHSQPPPRARVEPDAEGGDPACWLDSFPELLEAPDDRVSEDRTSPPGE
jgi:hypothetical protein